MSTHHDLAARVTPATTAIDAHEASILAKQAEPDARLLAHLLDDSVLAQFLAYGGALEGEDRAPLSDRMAYANGDWYVWNGVIWSREREPVAIEVIRRELRDLFTIATRDPHLKAEQVKRQSVLLQKQKAANVLFFLRGLLTADLSIFDAHPDLLNCTNGVVDLRTGDIAPHDAVLRFTKVTGVEYSPGALSEDWSAALQAVPEDVCDWLQERYGQAATGHMVSDDTLVIQQGNGSNGKSTIEDAISAALGDFAALIPEKALTGNSGDHPTDLMTLRGARLAVIEELPEGKHLPTKRLKDLVGTKRITARAMRQDFTTFDATHSLFVNSNYVPQVAETDHGTWRRLALVRFPYRFVGPGERLLSIHDRPGDPGIRERLTRPENLKAVLAWLVWGAVRWYERGRTFSETPASVVADTQAWREDADLILAYANARLIFDPSSAALSKEVYEDFSTWLTDTGRQTWNDATFTARLAGHELAEKNGLRKSKQRTASLDLAHRFGPSFSATVPIQAHVWNGIRFKREQDES
ncbi:phage/plasmid primase, P4 family [Microbacterium sp.]|uniref:DNA primase family protein n=1 Tax=Microbacterium sp. TaxID=51671 RepID=UPI0028AE23A4|nr:phage/plasmid primase, P4 family [Microbacterium sp.]